MRHARGDASRQRGPLRSHAFFVYREKAPFSLQAAEIGHIALLGIIPASDRRSLTGTGTVETTGLNLDPCGDHSSESVGCAESVASLGAQSASQRRNSSSPVLGLLELQAAGALRSPC